jgi:hypothetical protein
MGDRAMVALRIGDLVRIAARPDVDQRLWDSTGLVAALGPDDRLLLELASGADVTVRAEHVAAISRPALMDPTAAFFDR